ncbi:MAG: tape measure protein [Psychrobacillus sp.]
MATIRTSIMIEDRMSQQFAAMNMAMLSVIDSFEQMESASGNAIDVSAMRHAQSELQRLESTFNRVESEIRQSERAQESFNRDLRTSDDLAKNLLGSIGAILGAYLSLQGLGEVVGLSDEMTSTTARVQLLIDEMPLIPEQSINAKITNLDMTELEKANQLIFEAAQRAYSSFKDTADLVTRIGMNAGDAFGSTTEVIAFSELVQKQFGIAGASAVEASNATIQLSQALASGVLRGDELNSIFEQAPNLIMSIADYLEVPIGAIRDMAADGEITADIVKKAMFTAADDINKKFDSMPVTWGQTWTVFKNEALMAFSGVLRYINEIANNENFKVMFEGLKQSLYTIAAITMQALEILGEISGFLYENWSIIGPIILGVAGAMIFLSTYLMAARVAILLITAAHWAWNIAMSANPIALIIAGIIILIGIFYAAIGAINHFAGTSLNATGMIAGAFAVLGSFIANVFFGLLQLLFGIIEMIANKFISLGNLLGNVFNDPVAAIIHLFGDLGDNVLGVIEKIASAIDFVFGSNLASAVAGWRSELAGLVNWAAEEYGNGEYEVKFEKLDMNEIMSDLGVGLDHFEYSSAWDTGYDWGSDLFNTDSKAPEPITTSYDDLAALSGMSDMANALDDMKDPGKETAKNTKKLADKVTILTDDLKYLRDLSEREAINRYTTAEIKIDARSENHISSEADLDGIIDGLVEKLEEAAEMAAEGGEVDV